MQGILAVVLALEEGNGFFQLLQGSLLLLHSLPAGVGHTLHLRLHESVQELLLDILGAESVQLCHVPAGEVLLRIAHLVVADAEEVRTGPVLHLSEHLLHFLQSGYNALGQLLVPFLVVAGHLAQPVTQLAQLGAVIFGKEGIGDGLQVAAEPLEAGLHIHLLVLLHAEQEVLNTGLQILRYGDGIIVLMLHPVCHDAELVEGLAQLGNLVRPQIRIGDGHILFQHRQHIIELASGLLPAGLVLQQHGLGNLLTDADDGVQRGQGVLEDHGDLVAPDFAHILLGDLQQIPAVIDNLAALNNGVARQNSQDGLGGDGLAGTGLAHHSQGLAPLQVKGDVPHRLHGTVVGAERNF